MSQAIWLSAVSDQHQVLIHCAAIPSCVICCIVLASLSTSEWSYALRICLTRSCSSYSSGSLTFACNNKFWLRTQVMFHLHPCQMQYLCSKSIFGAVNSILAMPGCKELQQSDRNSFKTRHGCNCHMVFSPSTLPGQAAPDIHDSVQKVLNMQQFAALLTRLMLGPANVHFCWWLQRSAHV